MILRYSELSKNARIFQRLTGISVDEFEELESKAEPKWLEEEEKRLSRPYSESHISEPIADDIGVAQTLSDRNFQVGVLSSKIPFASSLILVH